jgi:hypothetical protein
VEGGEGEGGGGGGLQVISCSKWRDRL